MKKIIITSGYFNPIHIGHLNLLKDASSRGDFLVVIVNNDEQVKAKGSVKFMPEQERLTIVRSLKYVDAVFLAVDKVDKENSVAESLKVLAQKFSGKIYFAKGGDRNINNIPEAERRVCQELGIEVISGVGGEKVQSSSWLINGVTKNTKIESIDKNIYSPSLSDQLWNIGQERVGILGFGEVGQAIAKFYKNPLIKDLQRDDGLIGVDVLHVCIPGNENFFSVAQREIANIQPKLAIIHSTVSPGITRQLAEQFSGKVVHSPIRGIHPYLHEGIKTFVKYIGSDNPEAGAMAKEHLESLGIKTKLFNSSVATELGKLFDTTYYGVAIAWHGDMKKLCDAMSVDFEQVVTDFNKTYNEGYIALGKHNVVRPVLSAPNPHIGGHCVIPNARILKKYMDSKAVDLILQYEKKEFNN
jgi:cytidyltransferase-like protein